MALHKKKHASSARARICERIGLGSRLFETAQRHDDCLTQHGWSIAHGSNEDVEMHGLAGAFAVAVAGAGGFARVFRFIVMRPI